MTKANDERPTRREVLSRYQQLGLYFVQFFPDATFLPPTCLHISPWFLLASSVGNQ
jgi:hypothetical protein